MIMFAEFEGKRVEVLDNKLYLNGRFVQIPYWAELKVI